MVRESFVSKSHMLIREGVGGLEAGLVAGCAETAMEGWDSTAGEVGGSDLSTGDF